MINKDEAAKRAAIFDVDVIEEKAARCRKDLAGFFSNPDKAFEQLDSWLEKKRIARWAMISTVIYMAAQIMRAVLR